MAQRSACDMSAPDTHPACAGHNCSAVPFPSAPAYDNSSASAPAAKSTKAFAATSPY